MDKIKKITKILKISIVAIVIFVIAIIALLLYLFAGVLGPYYNVPNDNKYVEDYDEDMYLVSPATYEALEDLDTEKVELGVNDDGDVVFKHPYKAFGVVKKAYKSVWKYGDKELGMKHLSRTFYIEYSEDDFVEEFIEENPDQAADALIYQEILQIYANSYNKHR